jgi:bile acid-coenzyme A ligase
MTVGQRVTQLAHRHPDRVAIVVAAGPSESSLTWRELEDRAVAAARLLQAHGTIAGRLVVVALENGLEHFLFSLGAWKLGAGVLPLNPAMPPPERRRLLDLAEPAAVVAPTGWRSDRTLAAEAVWGAESAGAPLGDPIPDPGKAIASGGSTGAPKLIVIPGPWVYPVDRIAAGEVTGLRAGMVQLVTGPLYHNSPFGNAYTGLFYGNQLVVMTHFDAGRAVDLIERHRVSYMATVPTVMKRMVDLPGIDPAHLGSISAVLHTAAPCPASVKMAFIELVGAEHVFEVFGGSEGNGVTAIRGDEWLRHRGSVGRPWNCVLRILDAEGHEVPAGTVGEIFMGSGGEMFRYLGQAQARTTPDGLVSLGDLGWVDEEGYLYLADRGEDLIISGGANVYPAEVEAVLIEHPSVADVAVLGVPDSEWGQRVHAVVQLKPGVRLIDADALRAWCRDRLAPYKVPKTVDFVEGLPRNEAGKLRRAALLE